MKICLIGETGLLGQALRKTLDHDGNSLTCVSRNSTDVALDLRDDQGLISFFEGSFFDIVINTAAIVDHDYCERYPAEAYLVNSRPSSLISEMSLKKGFKYLIFFLLISSKLFFIT